MELNWDLLYNDNTSFPRLLQFGEFSDDRFYYGINEHRQRCLYFYFGDGGGVLLPLLLANIKLEEDTVSTRSMLILTLLNDSLKSQFDDLIISLVEQTRKVEGGTAKSQFVSLCNDWLGLFAPFTSGLSKHELQGLFAELSFLKALLLHSRTDFNDILMSWKGPFGKGHDYELGETLYEIKSYIDTNPVVHISSEFQLDWLSGQKLYLVAYKFSTSSASGRTIGSIVDEIVTFLRATAGIKMNLFWKALNKAGISSGTMFEYDIHKFDITEVLCFDCTLPEFPRLKRSLIPNAVRNLKYDVTLSGLMPFQTIDFISLL